MTTTSQSDQDKTSTALLGVADHIERGHLSPEVLRIIDKQILHGAATSDNPHPPGWLSSRFSELVRAANEDDFDERASIREALVILGKLVRDKRLPADLAERRVLAATLRAAAPADQRNEPLGDSAEARQVDIDALDGEAKALALLVQHPGWSNKQIADNVPCKRTQLYRWPRFIAAREHQDKARLEMKKGSKKKGKIEAW